MTAAERKTFMECSPAFRRNIPPRKPRSQDAGPCDRVQSLQTIRLAGSRRLRPVVPDRAAFGAAIEGETQRDRAENQYQPPEHGRATPHCLIIRPQVRPFQAAPRLSISTKCI